MINYKIISSVHFFFPQTLVERMEETENKDGKRCKPGQIHCSPGLGGGCCPRHHPVCCGNGAHCRKYGPC